MDQRILFFLLIFMHLTGMFGCAPELSTPEPRPGEADFSKTVAIGANFLSGYQDNALFQTGQERSVPALLAEQFKQVGGSTFRQPLMPDDDGLGLLYGKDTVYLHVSSGHLVYELDCDTDQRYIARHDTLQAGEDDPYLSPLSGNDYQNLSVPFATLESLLNPALGQATHKNPYYHRFASDPGQSTVIKEAVEQQPTFFIVWVGMEQVYQYARSGGTRGKLISSSRFRSLLDSVIAPLVEQGAQGVIANIPDLETFPYFTTIPPTGAEMTEEDTALLNEIMRNTGRDHIHFEVDPTPYENGFILWDSLAESDQRQMHPDEMVLLSTPLDRVKCGKMGFFFPMKHRYTLHDRQIGAIKAAIKRYNGRIDEIAEKYEVPVVDINNWMQSVNRGITWNGQSFNTDYLSGGFFSLDGYHPNQKGYRMIANEFIRTINAAYDAQIPLVHCANCNGIRFP